MRRAYPTAPAVPAQRPRAQKDLRRLYESLKIVDVWMRTTPPGSADSTG